MKKTIIDSTKSSLAFTVAIFVSFGSAIVALKLMEKIVPTMMVAVMEVVPVEVKISADAFWITALILVVWAMDLFVRPIVKDMMELFYRIGKMEEKEVIEDDRHSKANAKEC